MASSSPAWTHVVRGESSDAAVPVPTPEAAAAERVEEEAASLEVAAAERGRKPAWSKPAVGDAAVAVEAGPVIGGTASWPALSESAAARGSPRVLNDSASAPKPVADGSVMVSQGPVIAPAPNAVANNNNGSHNSAHNSANPTRQRSMRRGDRGAANGGSLHAQADGQIPESSPRDTLRRSNSWESGSRGGVTPQSHTGNDQPRNSYQRGHNNHNVRGEFHEGHRNRRDHDRGNHEWNDFRNFNGRDVHMQQPRPVPRNFMRPPPNSMPFMAPPRPFMNPMGYPPDIPPPIYYVHPHPDALRGFPFVPQPPQLPFYFPGLDPGLRFGILMQIDYYFSNDNLCRDLYLRQRMDEQGWVPISLIASFRKVRNMTTNLQLILDSIQASTVVEVQGDRVRRRNDWMQWLLPPRANQFAQVPGTPSAAVPFDSDTLVNPMNNVSLDEGTSNQADFRSEGLLGRSLSDYSSSSSREEPNQTFVQGDLDQAASARMPDNGDKS